MGVVEADEEEEEVVDEEVVLDVLVPLRTASYALHPV